MKFQTIHSNRSLFSVTKMCQTLSVSASGYYAWKKRTPSKRARENRLLQSRIRELYEKHGGSAGSPMITADLRAEQPFCHVSRTRVARHMRSLGPKSRVTRKYVVTTDSKHAEPVAENILDRQFSVSAPNKVWVTDITYLKVGRKWHYLTVFMDLFSRMVVGWDLSDSLERYSVLRAFQKALGRRKPESGLLVHSDRGIQYASKDFRQLLKRNDCIQSMSRKGNCWDKAVAESFFHTLKLQYIRYHTFATREAAELALFQYIEVYYNRRRRHSSNAWKSPAEYEHQTRYQEVA